MKEQPPAVTFSGNKKLPLNNRQFFDISEANPYRELAYTHQITLPMRAKEEFSRIGTYADLYKINQLPRAIRGLAPNSKGIFRLTARDKNLFSDDGAHTVGIIVDKPNNKALILDSFGQPAWLRSFHEKIIQQVQDVLPSIALWQNKTEQQTQGLYCNNWAIGNLRAHSNDENLPRNLERLLSNQREWIEPHLERLLKKTYPGIYKDYLKALSKI